MSEDVNEHLIYVPGVLKCERCDCVLVNRVLYMKSGTIGPNSKPAQCPNDCGPMWRITWKQRAEDNLILLEKLVDENRILRTQITELQEVRR